MNNQIIVYIAAVLLGVVLNNFFRMLMEGIHVVFAIKGKNIEERADAMNTKANKLTHEYIKKLIQLSVKYGARPDYALSKSCDSILDVARQLKEQIDK